MLVGLVPQAVIATRSDLGRGVTVEVTEARRNSVQATQERVHGRYR